MTGTDPNQKDEEDFLGMANLFVGNRATRKRGMGIGTYTEKFAVGNPAILHTLPRTLAYDVTLW
jgi:hypothetical protein